MRSSTGLLAVLGLGMVLAPGISGAQTTLGELLDAGAKKITPAEFKRDVSQRTLVGPTNTGAPLEVLYAANGSIAGMGGNPLDTSGSYRQNVPVSGAWTIDDAERICTAMQIAPPQGGVTTLPQRCQFWFKLGDAYFISDSDGDRHAKVLRRSIKGGSALTAVPSNLGELLNAGATRLSTEEFKREVVQRTVTGVMATGHRFEIMFAANGSVSGTGVSPRDPPQGPKADNPISGEWKVGDAGRICTNLRLTSNTAAIVLPAECQSWFKLGNDYFVTSSDSDRNTKVLLRSVRAGATQTATPSNLGELLDVGAKALSADEFRQQVIRQVLIGSIPSVGTIELVYTTDGNLQGVSWPSPDAIKFMEAAPLTGQWTIDQMGRVCTSIQVTRMQTPPRPGVNLPPRCQFWFKQGGQYFLSDSDSERRAQVFPRAIKP